MARFEIHKIVYRKNIKEHGWDDNDSIFNFEGGCYAKVLNLSKDNEPDIYRAIKPCALLENVVLDENKSVVFSDDSISQNSRVSYPIYHINSSLSPSIGKNPNNIFFLPATIFFILLTSKFSPISATFNFRLRLWAQ